MLATSSWRELNRPRAGDELKIVDDEQSEPFVSFEAAGFRADFEDAGGAGIINPKRRRGDSAECFGHAPPILAAEMAGTEFVRIDLSYRSHQPL